MKLTYSEEVYIKAIYKIGQKHGFPVSTNQISEIVETKAASVSDMLRKMAEKSLIVHELYKGVQLTAIGEKLALLQVRKHRLWECFLVNSLGFSWHEIHLIAEQLEHIDSEILINKLDSFLGYPKNDPHGDPIPDVEGKIHSTFDFKVLIDINKNNKVKVVGVLDSSPSFLTHLNSLGIQLGTEAIIIDKIEYDSSINIKVEYKEIFISRQVAQQILVIIQ